jgi:amidophosphoribosyltransferase
MRVSCPPIRFPCFYGVDFPTREELLANNRNLEQIKEFLEVDSIGYMSLEGLLKCAALPADHYCTACWSGKYRIPVDVTVNKYSLERYQLRMFEDSSDIYG